MVHITGSFAVDGTADEVWHVVMDPETLCRLAESCEEARRLDDAHYEGIVRIKLPLMSFRAHVRGEILDISAPTWMRIALTGHTDSLPGTFRGTAELTMGADAGRTRGSYAFDMSLLGKLGNLGQPFLSRAAERLATSFAEKVSRYLRESG
jgi:carbon monoxide dehydrogenase subunit G